MAEEPAPLAALQAVRFCTGSSKIRQPGSQTRPELPEAATVRLSRTHALPLRTGRGGLWPSVHAPQAAHAPSSRRLRSASPGRLRLLADSAPARSLGALHLRLPFPLTPRGGSGPCGTMFTSTGSSGLCEYRFPHSWAALRSIPSSSRTPLRAAGTRVCRRLGAPCLLRPSLVSSCSYGAAGAAPTVAPRAQGAPRPFRSRSLPHGAQHLLPCCRLGGLGS